MRPSEIAMTLGNMTNMIELDIEEAKRELVQRYEPDRGSFDNEEINDLIELHTQMVNFLIMSVLASTYTKKYEEVKKAIDNAASDCGLEPEGVAGQTIIIKDNGQLIFSKRQNKDGEQCTIQDLLIQLQLLNVDKKTIDKAVEKATKPKRGNVYYMVNGSEA